jgi:pyruvate carboxylase
LREQARSLGLESRWHEVAASYRAANDLFGDIVKVTPSSKVVGDMALAMVAQNLTVEDVLDPQREITFPGSVFEMMHGDLGQPKGGWPEHLQKKVLKGEIPITVRPGSLLAEADLAIERAQGEKQCGRELNDKDLASYLMYPKVFVEFSRSARKFGPISALPTPVYFYGMKPGDDVAVQIEPGKTLVVVLLAIGKTEEDGQVKLFFELNGQPRVISVINRTAAAIVPARRKANEGDETHVSAPMPGIVTAIVAKPGDKVSAGDVLLTMEAMKMEAAIHAPRSGVIAELVVGAGQQVEAKDLLLVLAPAGG